MSERWKDILGVEREKEYFKRLLAFIEQERLSGKTVFPSNAAIFNAFAFTPFEKLKVVIVGQDPYHGPGQAQGLCFSVPKGIAPPPSLLNIFKELETDLGLSRASHGCLEKWARDGVLLLNAVMSVELGKPGSHAAKGWEIFTDAVIAKISELSNGVVFLLWGSYAQKKGARVDRSKHFVLTAPHPSPLSAHRGFLGCHHFSQTNEILRRQKKTPIDWQL